MEYPLQERLYSTKAMILLADIAFSMTAIAQLLSLSPNNPCTSSDQQVLCAMDYACCNV